MTAPSTTFVPPVLPPLADLQWSMDELVMGPGTRINVAPGIEFGAAESRSQDSDRTGEDGVRFGRDFRSGRLITLPLNAWGDQDATRAVQEGQAFDALNDLETAWDDEYIRTTPGAYSVLRWRRGQMVRRAYGRPNPILTDSRMDFLGNIPATATFRTMEPRFYDDTEQASSVPLVPAATGGIIGPIIGPIYATGGGTGYRGITTGGTKPTWLVSVINGPISRPTLEVVGEWSYQLDIVLGVGERILVDPTPWGRSVRSDQGANRSGRFTAYSQPLTGMRLAPGNHAVVLRGADITGSARADLYWRNCFASYVGGR